jgi:uncharacterized membrane protein HdeD (DUF308 family)
MEETAMTENKEGLKTIWYLVGIVVTIMGALVLLAGIIDIFSSASAKTVLSELRPGIWWGAVMFITGLIFLFTNKGKVVK